MVILKSSLKINNTHIPTREKSQNLTQMSQPEVLVKVNNIPKKIHPIWGPGGLQVMTCRLTTLPYK